MVVSSERMCTLALTADPKDPALWYSKAPMTLAALSNSSMAMTGRDARLKSARIALLALEAWASAAAAAMVAECVAAMVEDSALAEDLEAEEDSEAALVAEAASAEDLVLAALMAPLQPPQRQTRSLTMLPPGLNAVRSSTFAT
jgi:hypothetical protein